MTRNLRLRREALSELSPEDLTAVRGGNYTVGDHCGPPFDTTWLPVVTSGRFTEATCTW